MSLVPSLLQAIIQLDGEALVMHAGDKPYVVAPNGQVDLATRGLTLDAVNGIVAQMLPSDVQRALDEFGAAQYELPASPDFPGEHFTVVAARGGDDVWAEIRRRRVIEDEQISADIFSLPQPIVSAVAAQPVSAPAPPPATPPVSSPVPMAAAATPAVSDSMPVESDTSWSDVGDVYGAVRHEDTAVTDSDVDDTLTMPDSSQFWSAEPKADVPIDDEVSYEPREIESLYDEPFPQHQEEPVAVAPAAAPIVEQISGAAEPQQAAEPSVVEPSVYDSQLSERAPLLAETPAAEMPSTVEEAPAAHEAAAHFEHVEPVREDIPSFAEPEPVREAAEIAEEVVAAEAPPVVEEIPEPFVSRVAEVPPVEEIRSVEEPGVAVSKEAIAAHEPSIHEEPIAVAEEHSVPEAAPLEEPVFLAQTPVLGVPEFSEEAVVVEAAKAEESAVLEQPTFAEERLIAEEPFVAEEPVVLEEPFVLEAPHVLDEAAAIEETPAMEYEPLTAVSETPSFLDESFDQEPAFEQPLQAEAAPALSEAASVTEAPEKIVEIVEIVEIVHESPIAEVEPAEPEQAKPFEEPAQSEEAAHFEEAALFEEAAHFEEAALFEDAASLDEPTLFEAAPTFDEEPEFDDVPPFEDFTAIDEAETVLAEAPQMVPPPTFQPAAAPPPYVAAVPTRQTPQQPGVVLPMARSNLIRPDAPPPLAGQMYSGLARLLRIAAARGASTLYLSSDARPSVRLDSEMQAIDGEPVLSAYDVESLLLTLMPERSHEALRTGAATEWISDIDDVGRVRCMSFRDQRGPGGVFRLMAGRAISTDQLGLSSEIQALAMEPEGLVLVAGPRSSGKRTIMSSLVDFINRTRRDHVITIEREINIIHDRGTSFISQREVRGGNDEMHAAARAALREDPDVLVIEELKTGALMNVAIEAAASGHLVIGGFSAHNATQAVDRIIDLYAPEYRRQIQMAIADHLRGIVVQVLLRKNGGGRLAARELLLSTPAVASVIAEGKTSQLPMAIEGGRRHGMVPLNDALVGFVQSGAVDPREAYRKASDRNGLLAVLKRQGIDTSFVERLA
jgi:twitching motility protein PilT